MALPFALRLLESGLPECMAAARAYFEAVPPGAENELEVALAICDSPAREAQAYGRAYIAARRHTLPAGELIQRLAEHEDAPMQELVAEALLERPSLAGGAPEFDAAVLRARDKGRRAKELVKQRLSVTPPADLEHNREALLELARSRTPRDAEWAMQQLARLAMSGEAVEGVDISGVGGV
jgi:hypothetical protein